MLPIPLHARSRYSLGFGTASVEALAGRAAALGLSALALTDVETLAGQIRFHDACREVGIRPISGVELRGGSPSGPDGGMHRLILLARNDAGYAALCRIVSRRRTLPRSQGDPDPLEALAGGAEGLFLLTDDVATVRRLLRMEGIDRNDLRLLLTRPAAAAAGRAVQEAASAMGVPLVADLDVATLDEEDLPLHTLLVAIRHGTTVAEVRRTGLGAAEGRTLDASALARFADVPGAVLETSRIAEACTLDLGSARRILPRLPELSGSEAVAALRDRCEAELGRARSSGRLAGAEYEVRLERELRTIQHLGFADYFVTVAEIVRGARELGVATAGRGSAAGSLVAFLLGITHLDPIAADLLFERFLHEQREAPPDIDLDVASDGRDAVNAWVVRRFGRERVAGVATYSTFRARSAVRAGLAALGISRGTVEKVLRRLGPDEASEDEDAVRVERALAASPVATVRDAAPLVGRLVGMPSHVSVHPGGIVLGDGPLEQRVPLERASSGTVVTQYDLRAVERAGFLKIDVLGNHFLSEKQETLAALPEGAEIPDHDEPTWRTLDRADTVGCFQVESPAVRSVLRRLPMRRFRDLVAALAVVRPGAAAGASKERYVRRARGEESWEPLEILGDDVAAGDYPELRDRLARTFGVLLYDEDIVRLLATVGGTDFATADALRSAVVAAGDSPELLARLGRDFTRGAVEAGARRGVAERAWESAARFASYSFAEAHAASYALLAWQAAWLRTHAPVPFGAALIDHHRAHYPLRTTAAAVARWGVTLLPPSVNRSAVSSALEDGPVPGVRIGLAAIKRLSRRTRGDLVAGRPFRDLGQLLSRARPAKAELRALLLSGACDELPPLSRRGYPLVHEVVLEGFGGEARPEALRDVLGRLERLPAEGEEAERMRAYQRLVRVRNEITFLDMHVTDHPLRLLRSEARRLGCLPSDQLGSRIGRPARIVALLAAARPVPTRRGELRFLTFEDEVGVVEGVLFPEANARLGERLTTPGPYLVGGTVRETDGDLHVVVRELTPFHQRAGAGA